MAEGEAGDGCRDAVPRRLRVRLFGGERSLLLRETVNAGFRVFASYLRKGEGDAPFFALGRPEFIAVGVQDSDVKREGRGDFRIFFPQGGNRRVRPFPQFLRHTLHIQHRVGREDALGSPDGDDYVIRRHAPEEGRERGERCLFCLFAAFPCAGAHLSALRPGGGLRDHFPLAPDMAEGGVSAGFCQQHFFAVCAEGDLTVDPFFRAGGGGDDLQPDIRVCMRAGGFRFFRLFCFFPDHSDGEVQRQDARIQPVADGDRRRIQPVLRRGGGAFGKFRFPAAFKADHVLPEFRRPVPVRRPARDIRGSRPALLGGDGKDHGIFRIRPVRAVFGSAAESRPVFFRRRLPVVEMRRRVFRRLLHILHVTGRQKAGIADHAAVFDRGIGNDGIRVTVASGVGKPGAAPVGRKEEAFG